MCSSPLPFTGVVGVVFPYDDPLLILVSSMSLYSKTKTEKKHSIQNMPSLTFIGKVWSVRLVLEIKSEKFVSPAAQYLTPHSPIHETLVFSQLSNKNVHGLKYNVLSVSWILRPPFTLGFQSFFKYYIINFALYKALTAVSLEGLAPNRSTEAYCEFSTFHEVVGIDVTT